MEKYYYFAQYSTTCVFQADISLNPVKNIPSELCPVELGAVQIVRNRVFRPQNPLELKIGKIYRYC
jgi:hypothetical protein